MTQLEKFIAVLNLNLKINSFFFKFKKTKFIDAVDKRGVLINLKKQNL